MFLWSFKKQNSNNNNKILPKKNYLPIVIGDLHDGVTWLQLPESSALSFRHSN